MRLSITGAQCVGKSTLLEALKNLEELHDYIFIEENMREIKSNNTSIVDSSKELAEIVYNSNYNLLRSDNTITDRYFLDGYVYARYFNKDCSLNSLINKYENNTEKFFEPDIIIFIEPEFDMIDDGFRDTRESFRNDINAIFKYTIREYNIPVFTVSGSVNNRVNQVKDIIRRFND